MERNPRVKKNKPKGQVMILVAMLATTFIFFFKFVVDTGILVVAKINLQNAADLAAYSGAASQARLLNQIGYLNYDMRKAYKKFLFKYYVLGTFSQGSFPKTTGASGPRKYAPISANDPPDFKVPVVCIDFQNMSNNTPYPTNGCARNDVPPLNTTGGMAGSSAIGKIYNKFIGNLNKSVGSNACPMFGGDNQGILMSWLFNGDPTMKSFVDAYNATVASQQTQPILQQAKILQIMKELTGGMGLIPRLLINKMRIGTLTEYLNKPVAPNGVELSDMATLETAIDPAENERTIEAFYSAYHTLGPYLFNSGSIRLEELTPGGPSSQAYAKFEAIRKSFSAWYLDGVDKGTTGGGCDFVPTAVNLENIPVGMYKDPKVMTYYAVRLKADAKLIYWPNKTFALKTYAVASPFGGFVGPDDTLYDQKDILLDQKKTCPLVGPFVRKVATTSSATDVDANCTGVYSTFNMRLTDLTTDFLGFHDQKFQYDLANNFMDTQQRLDSGKISPAMNWALIPNQSEKNIFLIANDAGDIESYTTGTENHKHEDGGDAFNHYFHSTDQNGPFTHKFWAPIVPPSDASALNNAVSEMLNQLTQTSASAAPLPQVQKDRIDAMKQMMRDSITYYLQTVLYNNGQDSPSGENGESLFVASIEDPLGITRAGGAPPNPIYQMTSPQDLRRSWVTDKDRKIDQAGRVGYSVKFIRMKEVSGKSTPIDTTGKNTQLTNRLQTDSEMSGDKAFDELNH